MEIVKLKPAVKDYIWGGQKLVEDFSKDACGMTRVAECWELSLHPDGLSIVDSGAQKGCTLKSLLDGWGAAAIGEKAAAFEMFPMLIKLIDACDSLSIQVHPSDAYALKNERQYGKSEVWYIVGAEEGAGIYWGFSHQISKDEFSRRIQDNTLLETLNFVEAKPGDVFMIESGTLHAICKGLTLAEIQQNSNVTYRIYDYDRRGADGQARPLHIEKALEVTALSPVTAKKLARNGEPHRVVAKNKYFIVDEYTFDKKKTFSMPGGSFVALTVIEGEGSVSGCGQPLGYKKGDTFFVPAEAVDFTVTPASRTILLTSHV